MKNTNLSVNLNKVALLRNSRRHNSPNLEAFARIAVDAGAPGLTLHPRADERHIKLDDVLDIANLEFIRNGSVELNIEGDGRPELVRLVEYIKPTQFTLVPCRPGELTSERGWKPYDDRSTLDLVIDRLGQHTRISLFVEADQQSVELAKSAGCHAVEFYTGHYAEACRHQSQEPILQTILEAADYARTLGMRVHCGHDLNLENLPEIIRRIGPEEVSIGHALTGDGLKHGFAKAVQLYIRCLESKAI